MWQSHICAILPCVCGKYWCAGDAHRSRKIWSTSSRRIERAYICAQHFSCHRGRACDRLHASAPERSSRRVRNVHVPRECAQQRTHDQCTERALTFARAARTTEKPLANVCIYDARGECSIRIHRQTHTHRHRQTPSVRRCCAAHTIFAITI